MTMGKIFFYLVLFFEVISLSGCALSMDFDDMPISLITVNELNKEVSKFQAQLLQIRDIVEDEKMDTEEKIDVLAKACTIRDILPLFWYLNYFGNTLPEKILTLNTAEEIFAAKMEKNEEVSFECVEGAMLAAKILEKKNIKPYILLLHGLNFRSGHAICVYRTTQGWATVGINLDDFIKPVASLREFKEKLNKRFQNYMSRDLNFRNIIWFSIREPSEIHDDFINGESQFILWQNMGDFFSSRWY